MELKYPTLVFHKVRKTGLSEIRDNDALSIVCFTNPGGVKGGEGISSLDECKERTAASFPVKLLRVLALEIMIDKIMGKIQAVGSVPS